MEGGDPDSERLDAYTAGESNYNMKGVNRVMTVDGRVTFLRFANNNQCNEDGEEGYRAGYRSIKSKGIQSSTHVSWAHNLDVRRVPRASPKLGPNVSHVLI